MRSSTPPGVPPKWTVTAEEHGARVTLRVQSLPPQEACQLARELLPLATERHSADDAVACLWDVTHDRGDVLVTLFGHLLTPDEIAHLTEELLSTAAMAAIWRDKVLRESIAPAGAALAIREHLEKLGIDATH